MALFQQLRTEHAAVAAEDWPVGPDPGLALRELDYENVPFELSPSRGTAVTRCAATWSYTSRSST